MSFDALGLSFSGTGTFRVHVKDLARSGRLAWVRGVTLHHTATPNLASRPDGLTDAHMRNIADYYQHKGWRSGPHWFVDDRRVMGMTPMTERGVHAQSYNGSRLGIEVLGDYDREDPTGGRGLRCWRRATAAVRTILEVLGLPASSVNFHRSDPRTSKSCPGALVREEWVDGLLRGTTVSPEEPRERKVPAGDLSHVADLGVYRLGDGPLLAPIAGTLAALGLDGAFDAGTWEGIDHAYYDTMTETTYGPLKQILEKETD